MDKSYNLKPVHANLHTIGASSVQSALQPGYTANPNAYLTLTTIGSSVIESNLELSGYQYDPNGANNFTVRFTELVNIGDVALPQIANLSERIDILDSITIISSQTRVLREFINIDDYAHNHESEDTEFDNCYGMKAVVGQYQAYTVGTKQVVAQGYANRYGMNESVQRYDLVSVTNATSVSNPLSPTLIIGGNVIFQGTSNPPPPSYFNTGLYVSFVDGGITNASYCDLYGFNFNLDYGEGSWTAPANHWLDELGSNIEIFGLKAAITKRGKQYSNAGKHFTQSGIFGAIKLNRQLAFVEFGQQSTLPTLTTQTLKLSASSGFTTFSSVAKSIAATAGITLQWNIQDAPYTNSLGQGGMSAGEALASLASQMSGTLRWHGNDSYVVSYPNRSMGRWEVPSCKLIAAGGISYSDNYDLGEGTFGDGLNGVYIVNTLDQYDRSTTSVPAKGNQPGQLPTITKVGTLTKLLEDDDPPVIFDLPPDYDKVYCQILIAPGKSTGGANRVDPLKNFVTTNPAVWAEYDLLGFASQYVFYSNIGGRYVPQVKVDSRILPDNPSVQDGKFTLSIACSRKVFDPGPGNQQAQNGAISNQLIHRYRYFKTYEGTINCIFFGSIPLPGMWGKATVDDLTVEGIIESVQFQYPGFITVNVARYSVIDFITNLGGIVNNGP